MFIAKFVIAANTILQRIFFSNKINIINYLVEFELGMHSIYWARNKLNILIILTPKDRTIEPSGAKMRLRGIPNKMD